MNVQALLRIQVNAEACEVTPLTVDARAALAVALGDAPLTVVVARAELGDVMERWAAAMSDGAVGA